MKDEAGKAKANIFFVSYDTQATDLTSRPLTFLFNGGPGAASIWLHLGAAGPSAWTWMKAVCRLGRRTN